MFIPLSLSLSLKAIGKSAGAGGRLGGGTGGKPSPDSLSSPRHFSLYLSTSCRFIFPSSILLSAPLSLIINLPLHPALSLSLRSPSYCQSTGTDLFGSGTVVDFNPLPAYPTPSPQESGPAGLVTEYSPPTTPSGLQRVTVKCDLNQ